MVQIINNSNQIKHLPYGGTLQPGKNEINKGVIENNRGHPGFENDIDKEIIQIIAPESKSEPEPEPKPEPEPEGEFPKQTTEKSPYYDLSNGDRILGYEKALKAQKELDEAGDN